MPGLDTITIYRGEDVILPFTMDPVENISGWSLLFTVEGVAHEKLISVPGEIVSGPNGTFRVVLTQDDTIDLRFGRYTYDVWRTNVDSNYPIAVGVCVVTSVARYPLP